MSVGGARLRHPHPAQKAARRLSHEKITVRDDAEASKPAPDIFNAVLKKLDVAGADAVAIGDSPYDAQAARAAGMGCIGFLSGGFTEARLRDAGCHAVYPGPGAMLACFDLPGPSPASRRKASPSGHLR